MIAFRRLDALLGTIPAGFGLTLGEIDRSMGKEELFRSQRLATLNQLSRIARIQSVEASNAIEGIHAPLRRIQALATEKTRPANRSEQEIAGYRSVLDTIHRSAADIPFSTGVVRQFHRDLLAFTPSPGGNWKNVDNAVTEVDAQNRESVRFQPLDMAATPAAMDELHDRYQARLAGREHHPLLLVGLYVLDFTIVHPFVDGNGRMSRLLTLLALYHSGYGVGRYVSLERIVDESRETYYEALARSTAGWHADDNDVLPWLDYFLGMVLKAYRRFEERADTLSGRGSKEAAVRDFVERTVTEVFALRDVRDAMPGVSDAYIRRVLQQLRDEGELLLEGAGRGATWRKVR